ncbi:MAG: hypothetical protein ACI8PZ_001237 [Myxococcota bacterium]|jgi:hypothetical protein
MQWIVAPRMRAWIVGFTGLNFSGSRMEVDLWPSGFQKGDIDGPRMKSIGIMAPEHTRIVLRASTGDNWMAYSWRAIEIRDGHTFTSRDGRRVGAQIPDLDVLDQPGALRTDPDFAEQFAQVKALDERVDWTYGHSGTTPLKEHVRCIMVDWVGD